MPIREITDPFRLEDIVPYFQPIVDLQHDRVWRYECLARLVTPSEKIYLPSEFLYLIERHNHVQQLTETMFLQSARYFKDKQICWNINVDLSDLKNPALINFLRAQLNDNCDPNEVCIEVSAKTAMQNLTLLAEVVKQVQALGMGVFVDNVGRVPGNIKSLLAMPLRGIKLDGGLIRQYDSNPAVQEYVDYVCEQAAEHKTRVIAEQVEDATTLEIVERLPIQYAQGFVFSRPKPTLDAI
ncbi:EAL domain-containing protein [Salinimonas chungwhensis]|uniref:EAL domain-containing protein n=1 Tax=Salinimonas chungwhensis TaxID=265425 RepID=UPI00037E4D05|nr:EAL domain-containing protein [Salinimonas chungwhensis]